MEVRRWLRWKRESGVDSVRLVAIGPCEPSEFALSRNEARIGNARDNDLVIKHRTVSRHHATIARRLGGYELRDLDSTNGTYLNGHRVSGRARIRKGDELRFGSARFAFLSGTSSPGASGSGDAVPVEATVLPAAKDNTLAGERGPASRRGRRLSRSMSLGLLVLLFIVGFALTRYVINWNRLEGVAEVGGAPGAPPTSAREPSPAVATAPEAAAKGAEAARSAVRGLPAAPRERYARGAAHRPAAKETAAHGAPPRGPMPGLAATGRWLGFVNYYRVSVKLPPVSEDPALSNGDLLHARYLVKNYAAAIKAGATLGVTMHTEDPNNPWYSREGDIAAKSSDVAEWWNSTGRPSPSWAIDNWMSGPFHRLWILNPGLRRAGYGDYCEQDVCAAALNLGTDAGVLPVVSTPLRDPIEFPPDGSMIALRSSQGEWPNPLSACPGYHAPSGLPVTLQFGPNVPVKFSSYSLVRAGTVAAPLEACGFDAATYSNLDPAAQERARQILAALGAVVIIARDPLVRGATYKVSISANGRKYDWSFSVSP